MRLSAFVSAGQCGLRWLAPLIVALFSIATLPAFADERIRNFDVEIQVETDGSVAITETIEITVEHAQIRRGIIREMPLGSSGRAGFHVLEIRRNGYPEPWSSEFSGDRIAIRIGHPDSLLERTLHIYTIRYRMEDQVGYTDEYDEIYWNATGNEWNFPIDRATARVTLPVGATIVSFAGYAGVYGTDNGNVDAIKESDRTVRFATTQPLAPFEGLTVAVAFPKGIVVEPNWSDRLLRGQYGSAVLIGFGGLLLVLVYYLIAWTIIGRDPPHGPIIARWESDLPPAAMRFLNRMSFDSMTLVAAIVSMAAKGWLTINETARKQYTLMRDSALPESARTPLSDGETKVLAVLLPREGDSIELTQSNRTKLQKAQGDLKSHLQKTYDRNFFRKNRGWFLLGILLTVAIWIAVVWEGNAPVEGLFASMFLSLWSFGTVFLLWNAAKHWRDVMRGSGSFGSALLMTLFCLPFLGGWAIGAWLQIEFVGPAGLLILMLAVILNTVFFKLLEARTPVGRAIADEIEGMKLYLTVAEKDRLAFHHPPERTPEHFEKLLPYAVALGVEDAWARQFETVFAQLTATNQEYRPGWYRGSRFSSSMGRFGSSFGGTVAAASANPSSGGGGRTGGSFGGGFSGGGGGGGGGRGW